MSKPMSNAYDNDLEKEIADACEALGIDPSEVDRETVAKLVCAQIFMDEIAGEDAA